MVTSTGWKALGPWLVLSAIWVLAIVTAAFLFPLSQGLERAGITPSSPTSQKIGSRTTSLRTPVTVTASLRPAFQVVSTSAGTVTAIHVAQGERVKNGDAVWDIDGRPVLAYVAAEPLWRDLSTGDRGRDVAGIAAFLQSTGFLRTSTSTHVFGGAVRQAVIALQQRLGVPADGVFRQRYVAFVPKTARPVSRLLVAVGAVLSPQTAVVALRSDVDSLRISPGDNASLAPFQGAAATLSSGAGTVRLKRFPVGRDQYDAILALGEASPDAGADPAATSVTFSSMQLTLATPRKVAAVASSAVFVDSDGTSCVFVAVARSRPRPKTVRLAPTPSTELGVTYLDPTLAGTTVVANPYRSLRKDELRCA